LHQVTRKGGKLFEEICGYRPEHFIASNSPEPRELEKTFKEIGVKYITRNKLQQYPLGDGKFEKQFNWLGKKNNWGQIYLTRNARFEPSDPNVQNDIESCINDIDIAFKWRKPAVISSHRVNYIGTLDKDNRERGLSQLNDLLKIILTKWPEVQFLTSPDLGGLIKSNK